MMFSRHVFYWTLFLFSLPALLILLFASILFFLLSYCAEPIVGNVCLTMGYVTALSAPLFLYSGWLFTLSLFLTVNLILFVIFARLFGWMKN